MAGDQGEAGPPGPVVSHKMITFEQKLFDAFSKNGAKNFHLHNQKIFKIIIQAATIIVCSKAWSHCL